MTSIEKRLYEALKPIIECYENIETDGEELFECVAENACAARNALHFSEQAEAKGDDS